MPILDFQRPDKVSMIEADDKHGIFEFHPLEPGYGITIGNSLRRILLSSLEGFAITSVRIDGVEHEFSTIKGVIEDVTEIVLNLKQVRFRRQLEEVSTEHINFTVGGKGSFTAGDIGKHTSGFQVLNPELVICRMEDNVKLHVEITVGKGRGYVPADENKEEGAPMDTIFIDSIYTPIKNVRYSVDNTRVEQKTDYEKLTIELTTDGSIAPKQALQEAAKILIHHFMLFSDERMTLELDDHVGIVSSKPAVGDSEVEEMDEADVHMRQLLKTKLVDLDLSVRALNCLKAADIETLGNLVVFNKNDLLKFRNFGKKSLTELEDLMETKGLSFGMNVGKYKLDRD
ncbi:MAG TPA: DNA-directed RNA polymerase subunit alpha [Flavobacteriales bacterium]|nr:DNA-directed RNA polymerase subunit alpha [Flavobacteriales bacterium]HRN37201.1 DNA-directed RNA polymerase subunit alpha [Flavobacteriales bacterium]HRO38733.1 DNA-directed RNA polymerase subunit alpha [Flavobacteriales bacterium]HRP80306.1 DNA-directed RNA polymerase subunit alpha [Flavobacteriales bacterium]HRQ83481.1 DNA-directed RNA polymerase subunit alpha [Flavobacteriales bacterium]